MKVANAKSVASPGESRSFPKRFRKASPRKLRGHEEEVTFPQGGPKNLTQALVESSGVFSTLRR